MDGEVYREVRDEPRDLSEEEREKLWKQDSSLVTEFKQIRLEAEARKHWDLFYKRNETKFFKDRHWTVREFEQLLDCDISEKRKILLEVGCGVGNFAFPLIDLNLGWFIYVCDFSPRAVDFVKKDSRYDEHKIQAFVCDVTKDELRTSVTQDIDIASLIFVLSAIHPDRFADALRNIFKVIKPGGFLIFRDYGLHDMAQLRFGRGSKISENFYVRQDGTRSYFFSTEFLKDLVVSTGFEIITCHYVHRRTVNIKEGVDQLRVFVQGKFRKPSE